MHVTVADKSLVCQPFRGCVQPGHTATWNLGPSGWRAESTRKSVSSRERGREIKFPELVLYPESNTIHLKVSSD